MTNMKEVGARVAMLRHADPTGPTQEDLAATIGVSRSTTAGIETGNDRGGIVTMIAIADHYKVPMDWLLCREIPAGGPLTGQFVDDLNELALVEFWRSLTAEERRAALRLLRIENRDVA